MTVAKVHRLFLGIITGVFMFAAYFLINMYIAYVDYDFYHSAYKENEMYFIMLSFIIGIMCSTIYLWYYNKGIKRGRKVV